MSILPGDYMWADYKVTFGTGQRGVIAGTGTVGWGDFYDGQRKTLSGAVNLRPTYHFNVNVNYDRNQVNLPNGSFATNLVGTAIHFRVHPAFVPECLYSVQCGYAPGQLQHSVRSNASSP